jgi:hypothetical protein
MVVDKHKKTDNLIHKGFERQFHKKKMHPAGCIGFGSSIPFGDGLKQLRYQGYDTESFNRLC